MRRAPRRWAKAQEKLVALVEAYVNTLDAIPGDERLPPRWTIETILGPLTVIADAPIYENGKILHSSPHLTVFGRFEDVKRATQHFGSWEVNPYSGKWNHHFGVDTTPEEAFEVWRKRIEAILPRAIG